VDDGNQPLIRPAHRNREGGTATGHPTGDDLHRIEIELEIVKASTAPAAATRAEAGDSGGTGEGEADPKAG
jgi:hypothetical protein